MEVEHFTDWGLEIKQDAYDEGFAEGRAEGEAKGLAKSIIGMMEKFHCSLDEAVETVNVPDNLKDEVLRRVKELQH